MSIVNSVKLVFFPKAFARAEIKESMRREEEEDASYGDMDEWYEETLKRVAKKRKGKLISFLLVSLFTSFGYLIAAYINNNYNLSIEHLRFVRLAAIVIVGWAVLGRIGYETSTIDGDTLLEKTSESTFKYFYLLGILITTVALFLEPAAFNNQIQPTPDGAG